MTAPSPQCRTQHPVRRATGSPCRRDANEAGDDVEGRDGFLLGLQGWSQAENAEMAIMGRQK